MPDASHTHQTEATGRGAPAVAKIDSQHANLWYTAMLGSATTLAYHMRTSSSSQVHALTPQNFLSANWAPGQSPAASPT